MEFYEDPKYQARQKRIGAACAFFTELEGTHEEKVHAFITALQQHAFGPRQAAMLRDAFRSAVGMLRLVVLGEDGTQGFFSQTEIDLARLQPNVAEIEIIADPHLIEITRELRPPTTPEQNICAFVWFKP
jgi:hypothetical protein